MMDASVAMRSGNGWHWRTSWTSGLTHAEVNCCRCRWTAALCALLRYPRAPDGAGAQLDLTMARTTFSSRLASASVRRRLSLTMALPSSAPPLTWGQR